MRKCYVPHIEKKLSIFSMFAESIKVKLEMVRGAVLHARDSLLFLYVQLL